jgi:hypothetical protein
MMMMKKKEKENEKEKEKKYLERLPAQDFYRSSVELLMWLHRCLIG